MMKQTILCIDDEIDNVDALERLFRKSFTVLKAISGPEALGLLAKHSEIAVIITDQRMPQMTGVELLEKASITHPDSIRILLTGYTDIESIIAAVNFGEIYRYLTKPWDPADLIKTVQEAAEKFQLKRELKIQNKLLEEANKELKALDQTKNQFMILINHELKTPLTTILSYLELTMETSLTEEQKKYLSRILQSSNRLKAMVEDSLKIVSGETGLLKVERRNFDPNLLKLTNPNLSSEMSLKNFTISKEISALEAFGDTKIIEEVLQRLLDNAIKFGTAGSEIKFQVLQLNDNVLFKISNQGSQIPEEVIDRILKPFTLNEDIMKHSKGTGLGLSVATSLLKSHNSRLIIENISQGVSVGFTLSR